MSNHYFATVARGLETIASQELEKLGAKDIQTEFTGVHFSGDQELLYKVNLWSRTIFRILRPIKTIKCYNAQELYDNVKKINWQQYLQPEQTLAINCTGTNDHLNHTHFTALQVKNAIVDQQRETTGKRSSIDTENPDLLINAHIYRYQCILSLDSSGSSLHRRGYRSAMGLAPLKETLASALLMLAEWTPNLPFLDPLCGSGILPIEAAFQGLNIAPGLLKNDFAFQRWNDFDETLWKSLLQEAKKAQLSHLNVPILGSDVNSKVISQAISNAESCGLDHDIQFSVKDLAKIEAPADHGIIICNPPYGKRLGNAQELGALYKQLGDIFKQRFKGWTAYILTGNKELAKQVGLKASRRIPVYNGAIPCTFLKYELY